MTIKYDLNGNLLWAAPYAGTALAVDLTGACFVTGFGANFNTVKLSSTGSNLWQTTYSDVGPTIGQSIAVDTNGNAYVSGSDTFNYYVSGQTTQGQPIYSPQVELVTIEYSSNGSRLWLGQQNPSVYTPFTSMQVVG